MRAHSRSASRFDSVRHGGARSRRDGSASAPQRAAKEPQRQGRLPVTGPPSFRFRSHLPSIERAPREYHILTFVPNTNRRLRSSERCPGIYIRVVECSPTRVTRVTRTYVRKRRRVSALFENHVLPNFIRIQFIRINASVYVP